MQGPSIKYVTLEGEGVREGLIVCDREKGVKSMCDVMLLIFLSYTRNLKLKVMLNFMLSPCNGCILTVVILTDYGSSEPLKTLVMLC